jgi:hypothetical protein
MKIPEQKKAPTHLPGWSFLALNMGQMTGFIKCHLLKRSLRLVLESCKAFVGIIVTAPECRFLQINAEAPAQNQTQ